MEQLIQRLWTDDEGQDLAEYALLLILVAVLIVTDEVDCSLTPGMEDALFEADTFWAADFLTSAACWNAGVACSGASPFEDCWDVNLDANGVETDDPSQMMLRPVSRYVEKLEAVPETMRESGRRASGYERGVIDLVEAGILAPLVGESFTAVVVDVSPKEPTKGRVTVESHAIEADATSPATLPLGEEITVKLVEADPAKRHVSFSA